MFIGKLQAVSDFLDGKAGIPEKEAGGVDFAGQDIFIRRLSVGPAENAGELRGADSLFSSYHSKQGKTSLWLPKGCI